MKDRLNADRELPDCIASPLNFWGAKRLGFRVRVTWPVRTRPKAHASRRAGWRRRDWMGVEKGTIKTKTADPKRSIVQGVPAKEDARRGWFAERAERKKLSATIHLDDNSGVS